MLLPQHLLSVLVTTLLTTLPIDSSFAFNINRPFVYRYSVPYIDRNLGLRGRTRLDAWPEWDYRRTLFRGQVLEIKRGGTDRLLSLLRNTFPNWSFEDKGNLEGSFDIQEYYACAPGYPVPIVGLCGGLANSRIGAQFKLNYTPRGADPRGDNVHWIQRVIDVYRGNVQDKIDILPRQRDLFYDTGGNADPIYFRDVPWQSRFDLNRTFYAETYLVVPSDVPAERVSKLTSQEAINPNVVEVGGIRFEILIPKRVWTIPAKNSQAKNPVEIGIRITNKTQAPVRFTRIDPLMVITLEIARLNGSLLNVHGGRDLLLKSPKFNCQLVLPGESLTFFLDAKLYWEDEQLTLGGSEELGGLWYFRLPEVGTYKARFRYYNRSPVGGCYDPNAVSPTDLPTGLWTGEVLTPFVEVQIVQR